MQYYKENYYDNRSNNSQEIIQPKNNIYGEQRHWKGHPFFWNNVFDKGDGIYYVFNNQNKKIGKYEPRKKYYRGDNAKYKNMQLEEYRKQNVLRLQGDRFYKYNQDDKVYDRENDTFRKTKTKFNQKENYRLFSLDRLRRQKQGIYFN